MYTNHDPVQTIRDLKSGNRRFTDGISFKSTRSSLWKLKDLSTKEQYPKAIILCCSDSRAPVEIIFDQDIGDLFVIRVAGNVVAPSLIGSIEFAAATFGTNVTVVMGHSHCGAVTATLDQIEHANESPSDNIQDIVTRIKPHILPIAQSEEISHEEKLAQCVAANVRASVDELRHSSSLMTELIAKGQMTILGSVLDLTNGEVKFFD
jgi:carbonic anhydrase